MRKFTPATTITKEELRALRHEIKFDMRSFATCLGIPASTYQRYEDGTAAIPERIVRAAYELRQINVTFMQGLPARVDAKVAEEFPNGFMSEIS
jgi:transcriptional regulator with XRE-family HTH domain